jgi:hypothetical protein
MRKVYVVSIPLRFCDYHSKLVDIVAGDIHV